MPQFPRLFPRKLHKASEFFIQAILAAELRVFVLTPSSPIRKLIAPQREHELFPSSTPRFSSTARRRRKRGLAHRKLARARFRSGTRASSRKVGTSRARSFHRGADTRDRSPLCVHH